MGEVFHGTQGARQHVPRSGGPQSKFSAAVTQREPVYGTKEIAQIREMREGIRRENPQAHDWDIAFTIASRRNGGSYATSTGHSAVYGIIVREIAVQNLPANPNPVPGVNDGPSI